MKLYLNLHELCNQSFDLDKYEPEFEVNIFT